jgi:hypothetical protein
MMPKGVKYLLVVGLYLLIYLAITWPLALDFSTAVVGSGPDPYQYIWNAQVFAESLWAGKNPFYTTMVGYPEGLSLVMHTYTPVIGLTNLLIGNPYLAVNLVILLSLTFGGFGAYLLAKDYVESELLAFLCGLVFAFSPYISSHLLEHVHLLLIAPVPFFVRALLKLWPEGKWTWSGLNWVSVAVMAICALISLLSDYYTTFFLLYATFFYVIYRLISPIWIRWSWKQRLLGVSILWIGAHLLTEHLYLSGANDKGAFYNTADLLSFIVPQPLSWFYQHEWLEQLRTVHLDFRGPNEQVLFLGFVLLVLSLFVPKSERTTTIQLMRFLLFVFILLAVPKIKLYGHAVSYAPTASFHFVPFINNIRNPSRFIQMVYLFLPLLTAYHMDHWLKGGARRVLPLACLLFIGLELRPMAYPLIHKRDVKPLIAELKALEGKSVWYIPTGMNDGLHGQGEFDVQRLQDQIEHGRPLVGGYISRISEERIEAFATQPMVKAALGLQSSESKIELDTADVRKFIDRNQLGALILDMRYPNATPIRSFFELVLADHTLETKEDERYLIFYLD